MYGWISGPGANEIENLNPTSIQVALASLLTTIIKDYRVQERNLEKVIITKWYANPYFRGSFSYRSMQSKELEVGPSDLAEPVARGDGTMCLQFAGEATHPNFYGSVHGAIEAGWREADRIISLYSDNKEM